MAQGLNDLLVGLTSVMDSEEMILSGFQGLICGQIISERVKRNMSQKQFADFMGVSQGMVSKWERGDCNFTLQSLVHIAAKLNIKMQSPFVSSHPVYQAVRNPDRILPFNSSWHTCSYSPASYSGASSYSEPQEM